MASTQASFSNPSKKIKLTIILPRQLFVDLTSEEDNTTTPSPITKSSSLSPPNAPSKTPSTKDTPSTFGTTSSSFESKPQSSNDTPSPQPSNPFLDDIMDVPPIPSNLILLQSHPSLDITLSLSPITPFDHILDTPSPPSPHPPPQPPLWKLKGGIEYYEALLRLTSLPEYPTRDFTMSTSSLQAEKTVYTSFTDGMMVGGKENSKVTLEGSEGESIWEEKLEWWFEQDIDDEE
ncbi:hypothetical protein Tco_0792921 [Tanacetum coccineum]